MDQERRGQLPAGEGRSQGPQRPRRSLPTFKRLAFEYVVMLVVTMAAFLLTGAYLDPRTTLVVALVAALIAMIGLRITRPKRTD